jgi:hypothetical protein
MAVRAREARVDEKPLPEAHHAEFVEDLRTLSHSARDALPRLR